MAEENGNQKDVNGSVTNDFEIPTIVGAEGIRPSSFCLSWAPPTMVGISKSFGDRSVHVFLITVLFRHTILPRRKLRPGFKNSLARARAARTI